MGIVMLSKITQDRQPFLRRRLSKMLINPSLFLLCCFTVSPVEEVPHQPIG